MIKKSVYGGTHRALTFEESLGRIQPFLRVMGITRIANITGLDHIGIPVAVACRPNSRSVSVAQGKGATLLAAQVSAAMESIESYHAENIVRPLLFATWNQVRQSYPTLDPDSLPKSAVGRFSPDLKIHWVEGFDLIQNGPCWVPFELVHTDFSLPLPADAGCFPMSSNGLASGNHIYEAISHGLCELVERDADALFAVSSDEWRAGRVVALSSITDQVCVELLECFERAHIRVSVWDMTTDVALAAFRVVIMDWTLNPHRPLRPSVGMGCHPSRAVALARALTEAAQARLTVISSSRDDLPREGYATHLSALAQLREEASAGIAARSYEAAPDFVSDDIAADVGFERDCLVACDIEHAVVVDLTKPEFGIPVARMIVPDLEGSREVPGWVPGRRAAAAQQRGIG